MLCLHTASATTGCDRVSRRDFLRIGSLSLGGLAFSDAQLRAAVRPGVDRGKRIVLLFLCGGPSHIETFAPNMEAPAPWRSLTGEIATSLPGVTFGATFPRLAERAHRLAVVRSYSPHGIADHATAIRHVLTAGGGLGASQGAIQARLLGGAWSRGVPAFAELIDQEIDSQYREDEERMRLGNAPGSLGAAYAPFAPTADSELNQDLTLRVPLERLADRRALLAEVEAFQRRFGQDEQLEALAVFRRQAAEMLLDGGVRRALDLKREDPRFVERYDTGRLEHGWLKKRPSTLGRQLLVARRLLEAGVRFITVGMAGWDNHGNGNHPGVAEGMRRLGGQLDHALAVFLDDLRERGLEQETLVAVTGEFGRTPKMQNDLGRDHWPGLCALAFAGGGLSVGQVVGRMPKTADYPASDPYRLNHLTGTLLHAMFDLGQARLDPRLPSDLNRFLGSVEPIQPLF